MRSSATPPGVRAGLGAALVLGLVATGTGAATHASPPAEGASARHATEDPSPTELTLVTGDTVRLTEVGDGRRTVEFVPGEGREGVGIHQMEDDGELHVLPLDVVPYLAEGELDPDLFNVDLLIEAGYDDASTDVLPLLTTYAEGQAGAFGTSAVAAVDGVEQGVELESINARALDVSKEGSDDFWVAVTGTPAEQAHDLSGSGAEPGYTSSVERIWLDSPVHADLHESTEQIGAPTAWEAGIDGTGVTVAVLDTGVDADHPDLAGQVTLHEDFSGSGNVLDHVGHGTHVAATAAGTGAGSDGVRKGVAPGATILSGKVLGDDGSGFESGVIAGMEWAVEQDADIVNLSLGAGVTDGSDPVSQAVNTLSADSDTLFVVSAGNEGPGASTISAPGSADAALTVGAVDRDESLADFSSRGPRIGDLAVKPDVTAPGVGIVAARAAGTAMGTPVDAHYTAANGTSMAAPHVAGAAALLAAQHPEWDGEQLKDALISSAVPHPDLTAYEQGGGRVDVARAVTQPVTATGTLHLGTFEDDDTESETHQISYTNTGAQDLVLDLTLGLATAGGEPPTDGGVVLSDDTVTVPAQGSAAVSVTVDPTQLERGQFTGGVLAQSGDTTVRTTLAVVKVAPTHEVTFRGVGFDGEPIGAPILVLRGEDPRFDMSSFFRPDQPVTLTLGEGDYFLHSTTTDEVDGLDAAVVSVDPDLEVTGDMEVVLDARETTQVQIETPQPATTRGNLGFINRREFHGRSIAHSTMKFDTVQSVWVTPTDEPRVGSFEFSSRWQLGAPVLTGTAEAPQELEVLPEYERYSPVLDPDGPLELVDAGAGTPADYEGLDVEGKIAVVSLSLKGQEDVAAAVEAGAAALMIAPESQWWTSYTGRGARLDLPVVVLSPVEGQEVLGRLDDGDLRMSFAGSPDRPYTYDVVQVSAGQVPEEVVHTVSEENSTTVHAAYHHTGGEEWTKEQRFAWLPWQQSTIVESQQELRTPQERTEIISSGDPGTLWRQHVLHYFSWDSLNPLRDGTSHPLRSYEPGEEITYEWHRAVTRPAVPAGTDPLRSGDTLTLQVPEHATGDGSLAMRSVAAQTTMNLWQDGELLHEDTAAWGDYPVGDGPVQLDLSVVRDQDASWQFSTRTDTSWSFDSHGAGEGVTTVLPLLRVDYDTRVGLDNTVPAGSVRPLGLRVVHPDGLGDAPFIRSAQLWVSYDEGDSWHEVAAVPTGPSRGSGNYTALVVHPQEHESVSLRVEATDADGNSIEQTVLRAYGIGPE